MKKIILIIFGFGLLASCTDVNLDEQTIKVKNLDGYVAFANAGGTVVPINLTVAETATAVQNIRIECPTGFTSDITVTYQFSGSAVFGTDFTTTSGTNTASGGSIILRRNATTGGVNDFDFVNLGIRALTDAVADGTKTLTITLVSASNSEKSFSIGRGSDGSTIYQKEAIVQFTNVNLNVQFSAVSATVIENSKAKTALRIIPNFNIPTGAAVTATYTVTGPAGFGVDYTSKNPPLSGTIVLPVGSSGVLIDSLSTIDDTLLEAIAGENAVMTITALSIANSANGNVVAVGTNNVFTYTIVDENKKIETVPTATPLILNNLNQVGVTNFRVLLPSVSPQTVTVGYTITGGTPGVDFVDVTGGTISFSAGQTSSNVELRILNTALIGKGNTTPINVTIKLNATAVSTDAEVGVATGVKSEFLVRIIPLN
ncbi:MAG: hypothetical protein ACK5YS_02995 [bacterium]